MTTVAQRIRATVLDSGIDTRSESVERNVLDPLRADPQRAATVAALISDGTAQTLVEALPAQLGLRLALLLGGACDESGAHAVRTALGRRVPSQVWLFDVVYKLHDSYRRMGWTRLASPQSTVSPVVPTNPAAGFTGSGATGVLPTSLSVPPGDQLLMLLGHEKTRQRYSGQDLRWKDDAGRQREANVLTRGKIASVVADSYAALPARIALLEIAGRQHNLESTLVAAFILAEQREQSQLEDAKDYVAATSLARADTSIGLGQVLVSVAQRDDLFSDLLPPSLTKNLSHEQVAFLLASDEFNIFATAKYIRLIADAGASRRAADLPATHAELPRLELSKYRLHSSQWPSDNIRALGSEYTSRP